MRTSSILALLIGVVALFLLLAPVRVKVGSEDMATLNAATEVLKDFMTNPDNRIPGSIIEEAHAIAVIPRVSREGVLLESGAGQGIMVVRSKNGTWSGPSFVVLVEGAAGTRKELGSSDAILVFNSKKGIDTLADRGDLALGTYVSLAAGPAGSRNKITFGSWGNASVYSYSHDRKHVAGSKFNKGVLRIDDNLNEAFYSRKGITLNDIVTKEGIRVPIVAKRFTCLVETRTDSTQACG